AGSSGNRQQHLAFPPPRPHNGCDLPLSTAVAQGRHSPSSPLTGGPSLGTRRLHPVPSAVRPHHHVPLPLPSALHRPGPPDGVHGGNVSPHGRPPLPSDDAFLEPHLRRQLRHGRGHRHRHGVPVRHQLGQLRQLRRRRLRLRPRCRGDLCFLSRVRL